ncbi:hypothetical protein BD410DRAFT_812844 [Rickenella mellea]|uniref:DUF6593 domain-containing protein n=1 Tax=Rickenella mellea TaxID=50990 RepID=A0A4Y7QHS7_9AGAM|nr:hypothetical protein BD410DRAFT_812844 [Rickenella mellea]
MTSRTLTLEPDNPVNTTLLDEDRKAIYVVETEHKGPTTLTRVKDANGEVLATLEWRDVLPDKVTIGKNAQISLSSCTVSFKDDVGRKYTWEGNGPGMQLQLFAGDTSKTEPIARYVKSRKAIPGPSGRAAIPATIILAPRALEIRDEVVMSCLFLEKTRRSNENSSQNFADAYGTSESAPNFIAVQGGGV